MANPNIVNVTSIYGKTVGAAVTTTAAALVSNGAASKRATRPSAALIFSHTRG